MTFYDMTFQDILPLQIRREGYLQVYSKVSTMPKFSMRSSNPGDVGDNFEAIKSEVKCMRSLSPGVGENSSVQILSKKNPKPRPSTGKTSSKHFA